MHRRLRYGSNFDKPGRSNIIDSTGEELIMTHFNSITDTEWLKSKECAKRLKQMFRHEVIETYRRRYPQSVETIKKPTIKTVNKYYKSFCTKLYDLIIIK